ncbi:MFS transporter [Glutamicibacter endophyticus]|uniref:MFS transporter n=1 Tax=Glutamicibacter endophyticus TaxID=1522174 RepID=UPI003AEF3D12
MSNAPHTDATGRLPLNIPRGTSTFGISVVGFMGANLAPLMILALVTETGMPEAAAGLVVTLGLLSTALVALATTKLTEGSQRRLVARIGLLFVVLGFGTTALTTSVPLAVVGIILGGIGAGGAVSAGGAALAALSNPNRVAALSGLVNRAIVTVVLAVAPLVATLMLGAFGLLAGLGLAALFTSSWLPNAPQPDPEKLAAAGAVPVRPLTDRKFTVAGWMLLVCFALWAVGEDSLWAVAATMGAAQAQLGDSGMSLVLSASSAGGLVVAIVMAALGDRLGRTLPLAILLILGAVLKVLSAQVHTESSYLVVVIAWNTIYAAAFMYIVAIAAALDVTGRWSGPLLGVYLVGSSFAPVVGTGIASTLGYTALGWILAGITTALFIPLLYAARLSAQAESIQRQHYAAEQADLHPSK